MLEEKNENVTNEEVKPIKNNDDENKVEENNVTSPINQDEKVPGEEVGDPFIEDPNDRIHVPWIPLVIMGVIVLLMIICIIVIMTTGGPVNGSTSA